ncbi:MAG: hypothetical protein EOO77_05760 [Oxalobacteraceae bacterium]|nr:MAG: hypothetical protein EOO77_05760 [Oxalobacteraceae bacterium]
MADMRHSIVPAPTDKSNSPYWITLFCIGLCILVIDFNTDSRDYADSDTYLIYLSQLVHFPQSNWYYFEAFSNFYFLFLYWFVGSVDRAIEIAHYLLGVMFLGFMILAAPPRYTPWQSLLFMSALLGSLLAFVTLRATPSYFLLAISVHYAMDRNPRTWILLVVAAMFHASAFLAALPLTLLYFRDALPDLLKADRPVRLFAVALAFFIAIGVLAPQISKGVMSLFESIPILSKYVVYSVEASASKQGTSINHYIFFAFLAAFLLFFFIFSDARNKRLNEYLLFSFLIYIALFAGVSPVAAVRQAPFWLMPMIPLYPWKRVGVSMITIPLFVIFCAGLFYFQFSQVYL